MKSTVAVILTGLLVVSVLTACGHDEVQQDLQISGAGIKGPLSFADTKVFAFDPSLPDFYDKTSPIATAMTDQYAQIAGLKIQKKVRREIKPPYIMTIGGDQAINLNSGKPPVIKTLIMVITSDMVKRNGLVTAYATPLTTLAFHMARHGSNAHTDAATFVQKLTIAATVIDDYFSVNPDYSLDIFKSPLVFNDSTYTLAAQEEAVYHRAAVEAFSAKIHMMSLLKVDNTTTDMIVDRLALDLQSDGIIDNIANGEVIDGVYPAIINQDPMQLQIPNTNYSVEDTVALMEEERTYLGTLNGPVLLVNETTLSRPASATNDTSSATYQDLAKLVSLSVNHIDFGSVDIGSISVAESVVLENIGDVPFNISNISHPPEFIQTNDCSNYLPAGSSCSINITFVPTRLREAEGLLVINGDSAHAPYSVSLIGSTITDVSSGITPHQDPATLFHNDINSLPLGVMNVQTMQSAFKTTSSGGGLERTSVVNDPDPTGSHGRVLRTKVPANKIGGGSNWHTTFKGADEVYFAYDLYLEPNHTFSTGVKLHGIYHGDLTEVTGCGPATDGASYRLSAFSPNAYRRISGGIPGTNALAIYRYTYEYRSAHPDGCGEEDIAEEPLGSGVPAGLIPGQWNRIEFHLKMNSETDGVANKDGIAELYLNGVKIASERQQWRRAGKTWKFDGLLYQIYHGGGDISWAVPVDTYYYTDNFIVSTSPITH